MRLIYYFIKRLSKSLKDHLSIILFIPTFLGGSWQILELYSISTYHIRFFSLSQLAADGLLILIYLLFAYFALYLPFSKIDGNENEQEENNISKHNKDTLNIIWYFLVLVITINLMLKVNLFSFSSYFQMVYLLLIAVFTAILLINKTLSRWTKSKYISNIFSLFAIFGLIGSIWVAYNKLENSPDNQFYYYDKDFVKFYNTKNINRIVKEKINDLSYTIQYFNDKYIFIVYENDKKEENYLNLKFDAFFEFKDEKQESTIKKDSVHKNHIQIKDTSKENLENVKKDSVQ